MKKVTVKKAKGKKTVIIPLIPLLDGTFRHSIEAEVYGQLGIVPARFVEGQFVILHMQTLMSFNKLVPFAYLKDKPKLAAWAIKVQETLKPEWDQMAKLTQMEVRSNPKGSHDLRGRIRAHCIKVRV